MRPDFEIWLDNQLPSIIAKWMQDEFDYTVKSSFALQLEALGDYEIFKRAKASEKLVIIISKDGDFPKLIEDHGTPPKLIKLDTGNLRNRHLWEKIRNHIPKSVNLLLETTIDIIYLD